MTGGLIFLGIIVILVFAFIAYYNKFIKLKNQADESFSGIDVQLKRRHDLIPNIVETVKGYVKHEASTLEKVVQARNIAMSANSVEDKAKAENMITGALKSLFALSESYPDLKANQNFISLQNTLSEIEDNIQNARRYYNAVVRDYNILCESFPSVIIANIFNFKKREFFEIEETERENVKVNFN
ncbi:LemA family protein [Deferribacterales bacterium Es71-Z0220]|uniref:LemA family protein n=1 Tax=Deferrivibrio essentukiensis TaxID=2880922 RepID=UPI001F61BEDF|nr:LemA family protein [Deferrivibrio essentukiensis]MCB4205462.1 LemA family protein [Deferrivibrio essentukiensis]